MSSPLTNAFREHRAAPTLGLDDVCEPPEGARANRSQCGDLSGSTSFAPPAPSGSGLDNDQLAQIFGRYGALILRWANRIFRDGATANDVLHEVMLRLLSHGAPLMALEGEAQRRVYLYRTTLRMCWDFKSKHSRQQKHAGAAARGRATEQFSAVEERSLLNQLVQKLDVEERILAVLFFEEEYTKVEIHALLSRSRPFIDKKLDRITRELQHLRGLS